MIGPVRFSADATMMMARYADETLRMWRIINAEPLAVIPNRPLPGGKLLSEAYNDDYDFSPDGWWKNREGEKTFLFEWTKITQG